MKLDLLKVIPVFLVSMIYYIFFEQINDNNVLLSATDYCYYETSMSQFYVAGYSLIASYQFFFMALQISKIIFPSAR